MKQFIKKEPLFFSVIVIIFIFIIIPIILRISFIEKVICWGLSGLKYQEYKNSYITTIGSMLGSFLAISGAVWTQRRIDETNEIREAKKSALIVYYDFRFAFDNLVYIPKMVWYKQYKEQKFNSKSTSEFFLEYSKNIYLYIDDDWKNSVAKLSKILSQDEIKIIYDTYGKLCNVRKILDKQIEDKSQIARIYNSSVSRFYDKSMSLDGSHCIEISLKEEYEELLKKLYDLCEDK